MLLSTLWNIQLFTKLLAPPCFLQFSCGWPWPSWPWSSQWYPIWPLWWQKMCLKVWFRLVFIWLRYHDICVFKIIGPHSIHFITMSKSEELCNDHVHSDWLQNGCVGRQTSHMITYKNFSHFYLNGVFLDRGHKKEACMMKNFISYREDFFQNFFWPLSKNTPFK